MSITRGSGNLKTESRQISGISAVQLDTSGELTLSQGETESLIIEAEDNLLPLLTSDVNNGTLILGIKLDSTSPTKPIKYTLVVKNLSVLKLTGSGNITVGDLKVGEKFILEGSGSGSMTLAALVTNDTTIDLSGAGSLSISNLASPKLSITIEGAGDAKITALDAQSLTAVLKANGSLEIAGIVTDQNVTINGSGNFNGDKLVSKTAVVKTTAAGSATVQVSDTLDANTESSGSITYIGNPSITQNSTGSGKITQKS